MTDRANLTPVAIREGHAFADTVFGPTPWTVDYGLIPTAVFTTPEVGTVGLSEAQARARCAQVDIHKAHVRARSGKRPGPGRPALFKAVVDGCSGRLLGFHVYADGAADLIQVATVALQMGARIHDLVGSLSADAMLGEDGLALAQPTVRYDCPVTDET